MRKCLLYIIGLWMVGNLSLSAQKSFTDAYQRFRPYHYQTPQAWNRIRCEVATHGKKKWPLIESKKFTMSLAGGWEGLIPSPVPANTHFFKDENELGGIYSLMMTPGAYGYVVYPYRMEVQYKLSENELLGKYIITKGFMNTIVSDVPYETELKLDEIVFTADSTQSEASSEPEIYDETTPTGRWLNEAEFYDFYNVKNFYCYFDNRPDKEKRSVKYVTRVPEGFEDEVDSLMIKLKRADLSYALIPYWMTDVYLGLPLESSSRMKRIGYLGYVINPVSGMPELTNDWNSKNMMDFYPYNEKQIDLVAYCGDAISINRFLTNADARRRFVYTVFNYPHGMINRVKGIHKPSGLNVYLPDFDFTEKRSLTQFVKSLSLVIDSFRVAERGRVYEQLDLSLTFSQEAAARHAGFIAGLQCFVDTVYFADFDSLGLARKVIYNDGSIDTSTMVTKVSNPFYLLRIPFKAIQPGVNDDDLWKLADCDYASGQWGLFLCIDLFLLLVMLVFIVLRYASASFNMYLERYHTFIVLAMITIVMEWGVFFFFMIEALSPQVIYFDFETRSMTYLALIALPILPILLYFLILRLNRREQLP